MRYELEVTDTNIIRGRMRKPAGAEVNTLSVSIITDGGWHYVVFVADIAANGQIYIDGATDGSPVNISSQNGDLINAYSFWIAQDEAASYFNGTLDEICISNTISNADWIQTSYNNQSNPSGFFTLGLLESAPSPTVVGRIVLPINKASVLASWLILLLVLLLAAVRLITHFRKKT